MKCSILITTEQQKKTATKLLLLFNFFLSFFHSFIRVPWLPINMYECWAHYWHTVTDYWPWLSVPLSFVYGQLELVLNVEYISMAITLYNLHMAWVIHPLDKFKRIETQFISAFSLLLFRWKKRVTFAGLWVWRCIKDVLTHWTWNKSECVKFKPQFCVTIRMTWKDTSFRPKVTFSSSLLH